MVGQYRYRGEGGKREKRGREKGHWDRQPFQVTIKNGPAPPFCLSAFLSTQLTSLYSSLSSRTHVRSFYTDKPPHRRPLWLVAKHCCILNGNMQTRLTPLPSRETSSQLENTTMHGTKRLINATDQRLFTPMSPTHTSFVSKVYGESESSLV